MTRILSGAAMILPTVLALAGVPFPGEVPDGAITVCSEGCDYNSIQDAVDAAEPGDTILLGPETFYEHIVVDWDMTILGAGPERTVIDGQRGGRVIENHADLTLKGVTIQNGWVYGHGGGISNERGARLNLHDSVVQDNHAYVYGASFGGGIFSSGDAVITNTLIAGNTARCEMIFSVGGGICAGGYGTVAITTSMIVGNEADGGGGVAVWYGSGLTIEDTVVAENRAVAGGGVLGFGWKSSDVIRDSAILGNEAYRGGGLSLPGNFRVENTTISGNFASRGGGGILLDRYDIDFWERLIENSTIAFNHPDGLGLSRLEEARLYNSIVAGNADLQCSGGTGYIVSEGNNLSSDTSCPFLMPGDIQGTDPNLLPLEDYGGPTSTHALHPDSPAIDAGGDGCLPTDQRGFPRPFDGDFDGEAKCDIGAFELGIRGEAKIIGSLHDLIFQLEGADHGLVEHLQAAVQVLEDTDSTNDTDAVRSMLVFTQDVQDRRGFAMGQDQADKLVEDAWEIVVALYGRD
jgi:hypothetical protein